MRAMVLGLAVLMVLPTVVRADGASACPADVLHRRAVAAAINDPAKYESAVVGGLKDADPMVRRYALAALAAKDAERAKAEAKRLLADDSAAVRKVAKMLCRQGGLYRENVARSIDPLFDHAVTTLKKIRVTDGRFALKAAVPQDAWVEIDFGKPKEDLYVWLNGIYLGQFDADNEAGQVFRLDATKETKAPGGNMLEVKRADGEAAECRTLVEVMK